MPGTGSRKPMLMNKPFKLGTTSFIFPDHILPNVKKLGLFFDEIELLVFESLSADVLPSKEEVKKLAFLSRELDVTYNIHLPTDVSLSCDSPAKRQQAKDTLLRVMDLFLSLTPGTCTLHLEMPPDIKQDIGHQNKVKNWEETTLKSVGSFVSCLPDPGVISIETLDYPFACIEALVKELELSVCIDAGHQIKYGHNLLDTFEKYKAKTPLIHLHGVSFSDHQIIDHTSLDMLPEKYFQQILTVLKNYSGVVSLEVFNLENLNNSLRVLSRIFRIKNKLTTKGCCLE